ncbi:MFS transporter [Tomitella biformata]|uniref:MFS transporter n=1 Tax=Tomitella biformata TaxID=630403 RepID=UPI0004B0E190|nr:MFS transporter [Tomitella biformata]
MLALSMGGFGIGTTEFVAMGLLPEIAHGFDVTEPVAGHVISAYALGVVIGAPTIAALSARVPRKTLLIALMIAFTLGNALAVFAPTYEILIAARFVAGLPHGAYFGVAALVAAELAPAGKRAKAVAQVMLGLSVANVVGVPLASVVGQHFGWRSAFAIVTVLGACTIAALARWLPVMRSMPASSPRAELGALRRSQVWLTLAVGMVGFGGMFAVYTYISTTLTDVAGLPVLLVPLGLMVYGIGMVVGNLVGGRIADRALIPGMFAMLAAVAVVMALFVVAVRNPYSAMVLVFLVGASGAALVPALQTRLMDVAEGAQNLAASLNHAALNVANAGGAWLGGLVIAAGFGYTAPAAVGALLAIAGLAIFGVAMLLQRRTTAEERVVVAVH